MKNWLGRRFASGRLRFSCAQISILDEIGGLAGCVDRAGFDGADFVIEDWINATAITLYVGGQQATTSPGLSRPDVVQAHGLPGTLGFSSRLPQACRSWSRAIRPVSPLRPRLVKLSFRR